MTVGSLFSGIGGLELGLEMCGVGPVAWQAESDPHARAVLAKHWPTVHRYEDVREIDGSATRVDVVCGGFPCQDISNAGKRAGINGPRSGLWAEFERIVRVLRPSFVFVENVAALANRGLDRVLGDLAALGFDAEWDVLLAADVGAPHRRARLFILAHARGEGWSEGRNEEGQTRSRRSSRDIAERFRSWAAEPDVGRVAYGVPGASHRRRLLGNAVVPAQAALAWRTLTARVGGLS